MKTVPSVANSFACALLLSLVALFAHLSAPHQQADAGSVQERDVPVVGGHVSRSVHNPGPAPQPPLQVLWSFPTGQTASSPVAAGDLVYVSSNALYAIDAASGEESWRFTAGAAWSPPTVGDGVVFAASADSSDDPGDGDTPATPPAQQNGNVHAVDAQTGAERWRYPVTTAVQNAPVVADGTLYFVADGLYALDAATGTQRWHSREIGVHGVSQLVHGTETVFLIDEGESLTAVDTASGSVRFTVTPKSACEQESDGSEGSMLESSEADVSFCVREVEERFWSNPVLSQNVLYTGMERVVTTGEVSLDYISFYPLTDDDIEYSSVSHGVVVAFDGGSGQRLWEADVESLTSPIVAGDAVYVRDRDMSRLRRLDSTTGREVWQFSPAANIAQNPVLVDDLLYVGTGDGMLYAIAAQDGTERWRFQVSAPIEYGPVVIDGVIYVGGEGTFHAVGAQQTPPTPSSTATTSSSGGLIGPTPTPDGLIGPTPTPGGPSGAGVVGASYTSPTFGYRLAWDPSWQVAEATSTGSEDSLVLTNGVSNVLLVGALDSTGNPNACLQALTSSFFDATDSNVTIAQDSAGQLLQGADASRAWAVSTYLHTEAGQSTMQAAYFECRVVAPGVNLRIAHDAPLEAYNSQVPLRDALLTTLTLSALAPPASKPVSIGTPSASPAAFPQLSPAQASASSPDAIETRTAPLEASSPVSSPIASAQASPATTRSSTATTYTSPRFGYAIAYDDPWRAVAEISDADHDLLKLVNDNGSEVELVGIGQTGDPSQCVEAVANSFQGKPDYTSFEQELNSDGQSPNKGENSIGTVAFGVFDANFQSPSGDALALTYKIECRLLPANAGTLVIIHAATAATYQTERAARERLLASLTFPSP